MSWIREKPIFPMDVITVSQQHGVGSHIGQFATDFIGRHKEYPIFAPFTCKVVRTDPAQYGNTMFIVSCDDDGNFTEVELPNGMVEIVTIVMIHSNKDVSHMEGKVYRYGEYIYSTGESGISYGDHVHIQCGLGVSLYWSNPTSTPLNIKNEVRVDEVFHFNKNYHTFIDTMGLNHHYNFKEIDEENWYPPTETPPQQDGKSKFYFDVRKRRVRMY